MHYESQSLETPQRPLLEPEYKKITTQMRQRVPSFTQGRLVTIILVGLQGKAALAEVVWCVGDPLLHR